jgi:type IV pilus assembly protein PilM
MDKKEFDAVLKAEVKKLMPYSIDEMALDYQVINNGKKNQRVIVNAASKKLVTFYTQVFTKAGLILEALEPESIALARSLVGRDSAVTMLIDMGAERTNFFIIDQGAPITHHSLNIGGNKIDTILQNALGLSLEEIEQIKNDLFRYTNATKTSLDKDKFLTLINPILDPLVKQIEYGFDVYLHQSGNEEKKPEKIILTGGSAMLPYLAQFLSDKFKMRCFLGDPWARVICQEKLKPVLNEIGPRMSVAIGLAMRKIV